MKIRPKTFKLLKELLLEKGGVFYLNGGKYNLKYNNESSRFICGYFEISEYGLSNWLKYDDWHIKV